MLLAHNNDGCWLEKSKGPRNKNRMISRVVCRVVNLEFRSNRKSLRIWQNVVLSLINPVPYVTCVSPKRFTISGLHICIPLFQTITLRYE